MSSESHSHTHPYPWLDTIALGMSVLCAIHCLLTPIIVVALPMIASSFWTSEHFHLGMVLFVVPTTVAAVFMGCKKHRDKIVLGLSGSGLVTLISIAIHDSLSHTANAADCAHCAAIAASEAPILTASVGINVLGGLMLASAHIRNFLLCRNSGCSHDA